jgi:hypothetical protein
LGVRRSAPDVSTHIRTTPRPPAPGFGSIRVRATLGDTSWDTSIFYDTKRAQYLLPVKKPVRTAEGVTAGDHVLVEVQLVE